MCHLFHILSDKSQAQYLFHKHSGRKPAEQFTFPLKDEETQAHRVKSELSKLHCQETAQDMNHIFIPGL